jgi:hypothetical protein
MPKELSATHKRAMQRGRAKAVERKRKEAAKIVSAFQEWNRRDGEAGRAYRDGRITREQRQAVSREIPQVPTDAQYALARGEAA